MYIGIGPNRNLKVPEDEALPFAMAACSIIRPHFAPISDLTKEFDAMLVEWFFSGDWIQEHIEESVIEEELEAAYREARETEADLYREWARQAI